MSLVSSQQLAVLNKLAIIIEDHNMQILKLHVVGFLCFVVSFSLEAEVVDLGDRLRDTVTGLEWLKVTETRGLSYNAVKAEIAVGGVYEEWRYATVGELDQLIANFGYDGVICYNPSAPCNSPFDYQADVIIEMIVMLGDTYDAELDGTSNFFDVAQDGAGFVEGLLGAPFGPTNQVNAAAIIDNHLVVRSNGALVSNPPNFVQLPARALDDDWAEPTLGSFLVRSSALPVSEENVPLLTPFAILILWFLIVLGFVKAKRIRGKISE